MIARAFAWWRLRSPREQRLLLVMAALFVVLVAWAGVVRPLGDRLADARAHHARAVLALAAARDAAEAIAGLDRAAGPSTNVAVTDLVRRAAVDAGFAAATVTPAGAAGASVAIPAVRPAAFFGWVGDLRGRYGLVVDQLSARANSDATLAVDLNVRARGR